MKHILCSWEFILTQHKLNACWGAPFTSNSQHLEHMTFRDSIHNTDHRVPTIYPCATPTHPPTHVSSRPEDQDYRLKLTALHLPHQNT